MYQTLIIAGNLGKDPDMRYTPSGQAVTAFSVAVNQQHTGKDGQTVKETIWFRVSAWGKQAEACNQYLHKGSKVLVEGRLNADADTGGPRIWTDKDGKAKASFDVTATTVRFLSKGEETQQQRPQNDEYPPSEDDIPF